MKSSSKSKNQKYKTEKKKLNFFSSAPNFLIENLEYKT